MAPYFKVHPGIGIARVGNSPEFSFSPEEPQGLPTEIVNGTEQPVSSFRDSQHRLKREACRFRLYRYDDDHPDRPAQRVVAGQDGVQRIEWTVHLANKKAVWYEFQQIQGEMGYGPKHPLRNAGKKGSERQSLIIDPGPQTLTGPQQRREFARGQGQPGYKQSFPPEGLAPFPINTLGEIRTDDRGELIVVGGFGNSGSTETTPTITHYANNDTWFDDVSDGPVTATIFMEDGSVQTVDFPAWVIVVPPAFVPQLRPIVTLFDSIFDVFVRKFEHSPAIFKSGLWQADYKPDFKTEVLSILQRPDAYRWVMKIPEFGHTSLLNPQLGDPDPRFNPLRKSFFHLVRCWQHVNRGKDEQGRWLMPLMAGDNPISSVVRAKYLTLTATQYFILKQWSEGNFHSDSPPAPLSEAEALDRAMLENCVGGPFCPGIEATWIVRNENIYSEAFRFKQHGKTGERASIGENLRDGIGPGDITKHMALPWQADFNECSTQSVDGLDIAWWPEHRPLQVFVQVGTQIHQKDWTRGFPDHDYKPDGADFQMVKSWKDLGIVKNVGSEAEPDFLEVERNDGNLPGSDLPT